MKYLTDPARWASPKSEGELQSFCVDWFTSEHFDGVLFHVPNHKRGGVGQLPGVSDLVLTIRGSVVFIELKHGKGRQGPAQKTFQSRVEGLGHRYRVVYTVAAFKELVLGLLAEADALFTQAPAAKAAAPAAPAATTAPPTVRKKRTVKAAK